MSQSVWSDRRLSPAQATAIAATCAAALALAGCSNIEVGSTWAPQAAAMPALGPGFAWESEADPNANDLTQVEPSLRDLIRATVEEGYTAKGYTKATPQQASFLLRGKVASSKQGDTASDSFEQYTEGTLVIYMLNPQTGNWIWRGWAKARLQEANSPEQKRERLRQAVQMMLKEVPAVRVSSGR